MSSNREESGLPDEPRRRRGLAAPLSRSGDAVAQAGDPAAPGHDRGPRPWQDAGLGAVPQRVVTGALVLGLTFAVSLGTNVAV